MNNNGGTVGPGYCLGTARPTCLWAVCSAAYPAAVTLHQGLVCVGRFLTCGGRSGSRSKENDLLSNIGGLQKDQNTSLV